MMGAQAPLQLASPDARARIRCSEMIGPFPMVTTLL